MCNGEGGGGVPVYRAGRRDDDREGRGGSPWPWRGSGRVTRQPAQRRDSVLRHVLDDKVERAALGRRRARRRAVARARRAAVERRRLRLEDTQDGRLEDVGAHGLQSRGQAVRVSLAR